MTLFRRFCKSVQKVPKLAKGLLFSKPFANSFLLK